MTFSVEAFNAGINAVKAHNDEKPNTWYETADKFGRSFFVVRGYFAQSLVGGVIGLVADVAKTVFTALNSLVLGKFFSEGRDDISNSLQDIFEDVKVVVKSAVEFVWPNDWFSKEAAPATV